MLVLLNLEQDRVLAVINGNRYIYFYNYSGGNLQGYITKVPRSIMILPPEVFMSPGMYD